MKQSGAAWTSRSTWLSSTWDLSCTGSGATASSSGSAIAKRNFRSRSDLRNVLSPDLWPHASRCSFVTLLSDKAVRPDHVDLEKAVGMRLTFRQPPPINCFSNQFLFYLNSTVATTRVHDLVAHGARPDRVSAAGTVHVSSRQYVATEVRLAACARISVSMRIAVLGLGFMGSTHVKAWSSIREAELAAVYSKDEKKLTGDLSDIQGNLGGPTAKLRFHEMFASTATSPNC